MNQSPIPSTYEIVYNTLKERILRFELIPSSIVSETETAKEFAVSRTPVRDAFKALVSEGLLEVRPHVGTFVTPIDLNKISDMLFIRVVMEKELLQELALTFNPSHEFELKQHLHIQKSLIENTTLSPKEFAIALVKSDSDFHKTIFALTGRLSLVTYSRYIGAQYERYKTFLFLENCLDPEALYNEHLNLIDCLKRKNANELQELITHHIYGNLTNQIDLISKYPNYFSNAI